MSAADPEPGPGPGPGPGPESGAAPDPGPGSGREPAGVVCAGSAVVDIAKFIDAYPPLDRLATIHSVRRSTGGPGLNMAVDLRHLGAGYPVAMAGALGDDADGAFVLAECERLGIDTSLLRTVPGVATSFTDCMVQIEGGRRTFFHHPGSSDHFDPAVLDPSTTGSRILHAGAPGIHRLADAPSTGPATATATATATADAAGTGGNGWSDLFARARAAGLHTNLELVDIPAERMVELVRPCLPHLDSVVINELEAGNLTGLTAPTSTPASGPDPDPDPGWWEAVEAMARGLIEAGVNRLAVVHFPAGGVAVDADGGVWRQGSVRLPAEEIVSATGAGDAFAAGVLHGIHEGWTVPECLRLAVASAATSLRAATTSDGVEPVEACLALGDRLGHRRVP